MRYFYRFIRWLPLWWKCQTQKHRGCEPIEPDGAPKPGWELRWTLRHGWNWHYRNPTYPHWMN